MSTVIKVEGVGKQYRLGLVGSGSLSADLNRFWAKLRGQEDPYLKIGASNDRTQAGGEYVWALKDINFEVKQGEVLGIIGKNGAGKSTLLKILSRVTRPTVGNIKLKGRIASLLEVGTGFHPELTGRENIFLNGAILGMSKAEIKSKFDEIVEFSGVAKYIDTPVKRYSSGMYVRLAFAVAAHLEPEILIVDEVLAVGDADFQKKAIGKMKDVSSQGGRTVLFVSHNMGSIGELCENCILLEHGTVTRHGTASEIISYYFSQGKQEARAVFKVNEKLKAQLLSAEIQNENGEPSCLFDVEASSIKLVLRYVINEAVRNFHIGCQLYDSLGNHLYSSADSDCNPERLGKREHGHFSVRVDLPIKNLNVGTYNLSVSMGIVNVDVFDRQNVFNFSIENFNKNGFRDEVGGRKGVLLVKTGWNYI